MLSATELHNQICGKFKNEEYSRNFLSAYFETGCSKIHKVVLEDIVSNNGILIGFCDVIIDYEDNNGRKQKALIEVKGNTDVIKIDTHEVLRQIKKYRFYNKSITKTFLVYSGDASMQPIEDTSIFTDENIIVLDINEFEEKERLAQEERERIEKERIEKERVEKEERERVEKERRDQIENEEIELKVKELKRKKELKDRIEKERIEKERLEFLTIYEKNREVIDFLHELKEKETKMREQIKKETNESINQIRIRKLYKKTKEIYIEEENKRMELKATIKKERDAFFKELEKKRKEKLKAKSKEMGLVYDEENERKRLFLKQ
jgi:hypothetical protein